MNSKIRIGQLIADARKEKGYKSQELFSEALEKRYKKNFCLRSVQKWEHGDYLPSLDNMICICDFLDLDIDYLIGRIEQPTHAVQYINDQTGLSEKAIKILKNNRETNCPEVISGLIEDDLFSELLWNILNLEKIKQEEKPRTKMIIAHLLAGLDGHEVPYVDNPVGSYEYSISKILMSIIDRITSIKEREE